MAKHINRDGWTTATVKATINRGLSSVAVALPATVNLFCLPRLNISVVVCSMFLLDLLGVVVLCNQCFMISFQWSMFGTPLVNS